MQYTLLYTTGEPVEPDTIIILCGKTRVRTVVVIRLGVRLDGVLNKCDLLPTSYIIVIIY